MGGSIFKFLHLSSERRRSAWEQRLSAFSSASFGSLVRELMFFQPISRNLFNCFLAIAMPGIQQSQPLDGATKVAKSAGTVNGTKQGLPSMCILLLRKAFHDGPFVNFEAIRQRQKAVALKGLAYLGHRLALPIWKFIVRA